MLLGASSFKIPKKLIPTSIFTTIHELIEVRRSRVETNYASNRGDRILGMNTKKSPLHQAQRNFNEGLLNLLIDLRLEILTETLCADEGEKARGITSP